MKREHLVDVNGQETAPPHPRHRVAPPRADARPPGSLAIGLFRAAVVAQVLLILAQPVLIGLFLSGGEDRRLRAHELVGSAVGAGGILLVIAAVSVWRSAHWPANVVLWSVLLLVAEVVQLTMGYDRHLAIHVPLGVALAIAACFLYTYAFKPHRVDHR